MDATGLAAQLLEPIPANRSFGLQVMRADESGAEVALEVRPDFHNVIGSLHSSGLAALIDATGLAAVVGACGAEDQFEGVTPLGTTASFEFLAPARGTLIGRCQLESTELELVRGVLAGHQAKATVCTTVEVVDADGRVVCRGTFTWRLRRAPA